MKKVLIISYYWPPSGGAGVQRWLKMTKYLHKFGITPIVLTVDPAHATYPQIDNSLTKEVPSEVKVYRTQSFELYSLYKKLSSNKEVPYGGFANTPPPNLKEKILRFIRGNFFLPDPRKGWNRFAIKEAKKLIPQYQIDTIITTSPPHSTQLIGLKLKKQFAVNWIADFRDPWTDIYYYKKLYPSFMATQIQKRYEKRVVRDADKILTCSEDGKRIFSEKANNVLDKIKVVPNGFDPDDFVGIENKGESEFFYITYVGTLSDDYCIDGFIASLKLLEKSILDKIKIRFVGQLSPARYDAILNAGLKDNIEQTGYVRHKEAISYMISSHILLLIIPNVKNNKNILTGKLFEYLATGRPILLLGSEDGDAAKILKSYKHHLISPYNEAETIANYISSIYVKSHKQDIPTLPDLKKHAYSRENLVKELIDFFQER